jgi:hypothetical protein
MKKGYEEKLKKLELDQIQRELKEREDARKR